MTREECLCHKMLFAVLSDDFEALLEALDAGADPNATYDGFFYMNSSILMIAVVSKNLAMVRELLKRGANKEFKNKKGVSAVDIVQHYKGHPIYHKLYEVITLG